jgi:prolycopene isomerase
MDPVDTFHFPDGSRFAVPADFETYRQRLDAAFPEQHQALDAFFKEVREAYLMGLLAYFQGRVPPRFATLGELSVRDVLKRHFGNEKLELLLTADCPHWGSPPSRTSFVFDSMLRLSYFLGNYYPRGGSQAFADELARCFEARGGDILASTRIDRIEVGGKNSAGKDRERKDREGEEATGHVQAVQLETLRGSLAGKRRIVTRTVLSNADLLHTYEHLLAPEHVPAAELAAVRRLRPSFPCFLTHIGLQGVPASVLDEAQGYYWRHWDPERVGRDGLICKIFVPTLYDPSLAPAGGQIVILQKVLEMDYAAITDWAAHKAAVEQQVTAHLAHVVPGIERHIVVKLSASAETARRFTLNTAGAMLGWEMAPDQVGAGRPGIKGPVEGLFLVGHWTRPGGGVTPVIISAQRAAEAILGHGENAVVERSQWTDNGDRTG